MNLDALTVEVLTELTNAGTVRRALKDADVPLSWSQTPEGAWLAEAPDGIICRLGVGTFDEWECSCPAMFRCRHLVRAVLAWQAHPPVDADAPADDTTAAPATPRVDASWFGPRVAAQGERLVAEGITARISTTPRVRVRILHPLDIGIRYPVDADPRYARCECGSPGCVHLYVAEAARAAAEPALRASSAVLLDTTTPGAGQVDEGPWQAWLDQLLGVGLSAADALIGSAVRLATGWESHGRVHLASALREIVTHLEHQRSRDAQVSPERLLLLIGEVESRLRALRHGGPAPASVVAGRPEVEQSGEAGRFLGLGAEWSHVGGWSSLRVPLLDTRTGAVASMVAERGDTADHLVDPADLLRVRHAGVPLGEWATGSALVPRFRRRGDTLAVGRTRVTLAPTPAPAWDEASLSGIIPDGFADVAAQLTGVPGPLGPRRPSDGVLLARLTRADAVEADATTSMVTAQLTDAAGDQATLRLTWDPRTIRGARRLIGLLETQPPVAIAGRWRDGEDGLEVDPMAVWVREGVFLPQVDLAVGCEPPEASRWPAVGVDPWRDAWEGLAQPMGQLLILGALRGAATVVAPLERGRERAESVGLSHVADVAGRLRRCVGDPLALRAVFADACVLLAFAA